ncbi:secernin-1-like [Anneissia japonica]|uniref:secernin-1-like n=1 Tax=Anneissia japonica TaxID=1529436 RepID=UPI001425B62A|nr:secernin-1-like [Anneissia japonica]
MASSHPSDAFVALPPATVGGVIVFAKNAGHTNEAVQEVIYCPAADHVTKTKCTYIEVDQLSHTHAVLLCKVPWMWGADMGANEKGVCIGNIPVDSKSLGDADKEGKLTGPDLVRLGLERGDSAKDALDIITSLIKTFGTGGSCSEGQESVFHNSFMIADRKEAWVLETAGKDWVAEQITEGVRNISNSYTIYTKRDEESDSIKDKGSDFDFCGTFQADTCSGRFAAAKELIEKASGSLDVNAMMNILRDQSSGVCQSGPDRMTVGSMVSILTPEGSSAPCFHLVTATPDPSLSVFKPFAFTEDTSFPDFTVSPSKTDPKHKLYKLHEAARGSLKQQDGQSKELKDVMLDLEQMALEGIKETIQGQQVMSSDLKSLFEDCVDSEMKFYD